MQLYIYSSILVKYAVQQLIIIRCPRDLKFLARRKRCIQAYYAKSSGSSAEPDYLLSYRANETCFPPHSLPTRSTHLGHCSLFVVSHDADLACFFLPSFLTPTLAETSHDLSLLDNLQSSVLKIRICSFLRNKWPMHCTAKQRSTSEFALS